MATARARTSTAPIAVVDAPDAVEARRRSTLTPRQPVASEVSTTLSIDAATAYEVFCDALEIPRWLPIIQTARVVERYPDDRAKRVAFIRALDRGSLAYTLGYTYDPRTFSVAWAAPEASNVVLTGEARFSPLDGGACMMLYQLIIDLPIVDDLLNCELDKHPASQVVADFREHLRRLC